MPNWITITADDLKAAGHGALVDQARTVAIGAVDPVTEEIENAIARVRRAIAQGGNALDADPSKIPLSLKSIVNHLVLYALSERIGLSLSDDQKETRRNDNSDLLRIADPNKFTPIETPDTPAGQGEMQTPGGIDTVTGTDRDRYTRKGMDGL